MPKILIENLHNKEIFSNNAKHSLLDMVHANYIDWMHACGGKGRCTTCKAIVISGVDHFSRRTEAEIKFQSLKKLKDNERLACQCQISDDVVIRVSDENKFPHLDYST